MVVEVVGPLRSLRHLARLLSWRRRQFRHVRRIEGERLLFGAPTGEQRHQLDTAAAAAADVVGLAGATLIRLFRWSMVRLRMLLLQSRIALPAVGRVAKRHATVAAALRTAALHRRQERRRFRGRRLRRRRGRCRRRLTIIQPIVVTRRSHRIDLLQRPPVRPAHRLLERVADVLRMAPRQAARPGASPRTRRRWLADARRFWADWWAKNRGNEWK